MQLGAPYAGPEPTALDCLVMLGIIALVWVAGLSLVFSIRWAVRVVLDWIDRRRWRPR